MMSDPHPTYQGLLARFLELPPPPGAAEAAYALLLEVGATNITTTIAATAQGDASLYLSTGGGLLGGWGIAEARESAQRMVNIANQLADRTEPTDDLRAPTSGEIALFLLTAGGPRVLRSPIAAKFAPDNPLIALLREQGVLIAALRSSPAKGVAVPG
jgi:hypothetical protein